jgi:hypothetical protein
LASEDYEPEVRFDISNIDITTSGLRLYSLNSSGLEAAYVRNIVHSGVSATSGTILSLVAPNIQLDNMRFEHGHDNYESSEANGFAVVEVFASNTTLSGLSFVSNNAQKLGAIAIFNGSGGTSTVDNTLIQFVEIGSGVSNGSYVAGIGLIARSGVGEITNVTIQSGFIQSSGTTTYDGLVFNSNDQHQISGVSVLGNVFKNNLQGILLFGSGANNVVIEDNIFDTNTTHVVDRTTPASFVSLRNDILVGQGNTFGPAVNIDALINNALVVGNTITSARQNFTNVEKLEAYST